MSKPLIKPIQQDEALLADIESTHAEAEGRLRIWWLGQSGFLVQINGKHLLFDPYLSDSLTLKYADTEKPHVRMTERVIAPEKLTYLVDVVTSTHSHTDHLDRATLKPLTDAVNRGHGDLFLVLPEATKSLAVDRLHGCALTYVTMNAGQSQQVAGFRIHAVPGAHPEFTKDELGRHFYLGYVVQVDGYTIYHSGDTMSHYLIASELSAFDIDIAILPINGKVGNMGGAAAAEFAHSIGATLVIPCHYQMFEFNTADPEDQFIPACEKLGQPYRVLRAGEKLTFTPKGRPR